MCQCVSISVRSVCLFSKGRVSRLVGQQGCVGLQVSIHLHLLLSEKAGLRLQSGLPCISQLCQHTKV